MSAVVQVNFDPKRRQPYRAVGRGVYIDPRRGTEKKGPFFERPVIEGRPTFRKLASTTLRFAEDEVARNRTNQRLAERGLAHDPYKRSDAIAISELCDLYVTSGCPKARGKHSPRSEASLKEEKAIVVRLRTWWGKKKWDAIALEDCDAYARARKPEMKERAGGSRFSGHRMIDRELTTLSNIFRLAIKNSRSTGVKRNPIEKRDRLVDPRTVEHCRLFQPTNGDELHALARFLFQSRESAVLGWQLLYEAMVGQRTHELLKLRRDAKNEFQAGFIRDTSLFLFRSGTSKGTFPFATIHPALRQLIEAHSRWLTENYPDSPWFFPSPKDQTKPVGKGALSQRLRKILPAMGLTKRTTHGLRSYCVNVWRSQKTADGARKFSDAEIALRIGHETGGKLIVTTYGQVMEYELSWMPRKGEPPAWACFAPKLQEKAAFNFTRSPAQTSFAFYPMAIQCELPL